MHYIDVKIIYSYIYIFWHFVIYFSHYYATLVMIDCVVYLLYTLILYFLIS